MSYSTSEHEWSEFNDSPSHGAERSGAAQQLARAWIVAELGHRDATQRERRRIVAQRNPFESAERIAGGERASGGGDQGVHRDRLLRGGAV